ncbi:MAG: TRAP transporter permease [Eubacteriales bacterium]|nr:TRAP transporter permease [Eubacteriales bacterium]
MGTEKDTKIDSEKLMRQFDKESATRIWTGPMSKVMKLLTAVFSMYCIWSTLFSTAALEVRLTSFLGVVIIIGYMNYPANKHHVRENHIPWYDIVLMIIGAAAFFYYCMNYNTFARTLSSASKMTPMLSIIGIVGILVLMELCRRCVGLPILCVAGVLIAYSFVTLKGNGQSAMEVINRMMYTLFYSTGGVLGTPVQVCAKFIVVFIVFGAFLERTGISEFFISCANALVGSASGGPAKVAVISSALCGMVSGSSVGNTVTTGSVTIPMMKKTGYSPEFSAAVEASASTGGQIMPPIMGAAAFLMAEYMGVASGQVALWAILPAVLYFAGVFIAVHLEAKKLNLKGMSKDMLPKWGVLIKKVYLLLPLIVLVWLVASNTRTLAFSAVIAIFLAIFVSVPGAIGKAMANAGEGSNSKKSVAVNALMGMKDMIMNSLSAGASGCVTVVIACSMAGIVAGCITATGLASKLITSVIGISSQMPSEALALLIALILTMLCCIVLGMGVPTTANYCIMASTCAPILVQMGVNPIAAHFFVFYFGIVADITPPVALAAYAGSAIAKSNPMKTGINATKLAIGAFVVPFVFAMQPSMILMDKGILDALLVVITSIVGIFALAASLNGFVFKKLNPVLRIMLIAGGLTLLFPGLVTDLVGFVLVGGALMLNYLEMKRARA